jgi:hypothetical protein
VLFMDDERVLCNDDVAPYECSYQPRGEDVGHDTLAATAIDGGQQAATAVREVTVSRFKATGLSLSRRASKAHPARLRVRGTLRLPAALTKALGCRGKVKVRARVGRRVAASRTVNLTKSCRYSARMRVGNSAARLQASFAGNDFVKARSSKRVKARAG